MSAFTNAVGASLAGTMGTIFGAMAAAQAQARAEEQARAAEQARAQEQADARFWEERTRFWKELARSYGASFDEMVEICDKTAKQYETIKDLYDKTIAYYDDLKKKYDDLTEHARTLQAKLQRKEEALAKVRRELEGAKAAAEKANQQVWDLQVALKQQTGAAAGAQQKLQQLARSDRENQDLRAVAERMIQRNMDLEAQLKGQTAQAAALQAQVDKLKTQLEAVRKWHAANLALRSALEVQLLRADPDNPLLQDAPLRDRVRRAGEVAAAMAPQDDDVDPYDAAREAGASFSVPGRPSGAQVLEELVLAEAYMRRLLQLNLPQDHALRLLQSLQRGHGTMTAARELLQQMEPGSELLSAQATQRAREIAMEEFQRQQQRLQQRQHETAMDAMLVRSQQHVRERAARELVPQPADDPPAAMAAAA